MRAKEKFLVTGGAGFIGSNLTAYLLEEGYSVRVFDNFLTGKKSNIEGLSRAYPGQFELLEGDLRDGDSVRKACRNIDFILHQGALPSVPRSVEDPVLSNSINVNGTLNLLMAAKEMSVKRVVFASSSSIYGDTEELPKVETMPPAPKSPYALQKLAGEHYMSLFYNLFGLETVSLRYFNVFGAKQDPQSDYAAVIPKFITAMLNGSRPTVYGDGRQTRDFTYVENVISANLKACFAPVSACKGPMNVACGERYSLLDLLSCLEKITGVKADPRFEPERPGDVRDSMADIHLSEKSIDFKVKVDFENGLRKTVAWYREKF